MDHLEDCQRYSLWEIFRDHLHTFVGAFLVNISIAISRYAEICVVIYVIEFAHARGCTNLWLERDSILLIQAFTYVNLVHWKVKMKWKNSLHIIKKSSFRFSHIYRERKIHVQINWLTHNYIFIFWFAPTV
jgi:ribonuclease HI